MKPFLERLAEKVIVFDGAMGTNLQAQQLSPEDFGGEKYFGCNEYLVLTRPVSVEKVHTQFLEAGCDVVETDSFGSTSVVLAEYDLADQAYALNVAAARLAKRVANAFSSPSHPRYVAGSMGPTTKLPSLGHISFKEMEHAYYVQAKGLVDGGADLLIVETCQDVLQTKSALAGIFQFFSDVRSQVPVIASVTVETMGTMLLGTEIAAALTTLEPFDLAAIGLNCATGPREMSECIRYLCQNSPKPVFAMPNAGIPENIGGKAAYRLTPDELVYYLGHFVRDIGVGIVGGCCGTTRDHIRKLVEAVGSTEPIRRQWTYTPSCSSLYQSVPLHVEPAPVMIGERTNANGSKQFRDLLADEDWDGMVGMAKTQVREGSHLLDVCVAYVGRTELEDMRQVIHRFNTQVTSPLMIDSTEANVLEEALRSIGGRAIVNSVNLEDGEERLGKICTICKKYGAAVVALTIDERGMAKTVERKLEIARRIRNLAVEKYGMRDQDLVFDTLTFTLASGDEEFRRAGIATIEALRAIKKEFPQVYTSLGVSNISFGLAPQARHVLNSMFLHYAIQYGLDLAIVHASKILPLFKISEAEQELCRRLIFDERTADSDPLQALMTFYSERKEQATKIHREALTLEERLKRRVVEGDKIGLQNDLDEARKKYPPLEIINTILLGGMKTVGELFGSGQMQLPFVLQSAEVMKNAVAYLEKFMDKAATTSKGTLIIATVKGDVHDIGKNLVDIILTNNGYKVVNLGIQCPLDTMMSAFQEHHADALGMSGLLVKSTIVMKENLGVMNERRTYPPVILGGAALTRRYVEEDLRAVYPGDLFYANDAFDGLRYMDEIMQKKSSPKGQATNPPDPKDAGPVPESPAQKLPADTGTKSSIRRSAVESAEIPRPPFYGTRVVSNLPVTTIYPYVNETALIKGQWQVRKGDMTEQEYRRFLKDKIYPELRRLEDEVARRHLLEPGVVYGYFPCQSEGDDLIVYVPAGVENFYDEWDPRLQDLLRNESAPASALKEGARFTFPRQKSDRNLCIADFFRPASSGLYDVVGFHLVTMGTVASEYAGKLFADHQYQEYLYFHGLSVESAEALAEYWHKVIREELKIHQADAPDVKKLFSQKYQGSRFSFGYPACPNLEDQKKLFHLLQPGRIRVSLTEEYQLVPEQSTSAIVVHHPKAKYFTID